MNPLKVVGNFGNGIVKTIKKNDTTLMTAGVVIGIAGTMYLTHKASIKAYAVIEEAEYTNSMPLTRQEKVKKVWKIYVAPFASAVATISLAVGCQALNRRKEAKILEAYLMAKSAKNEFINKTESIIGENKTNKIREEIVKDHINANPPTDENVELTTYGDTLIYDEWLDKYFKHDIAKIKEGFNTFASDFNAGKIGTYEDICYDVYGVSCPKRAHDYGWVPGYDNMPNPRYTSSLAPQTDTPCFVISWYEDNEPEIIGRSKRDN